MKICIWMTKKLSEDEADELLGEIEECGYDFKGRRAPARWEGELLPVEGQPDTQTLLEELWEQTVVRAFHVTKEA